MEGNIPSNDAGSLKRQHFLLSAIHEGGTEGTSPERRRKRRRKEKEAARKKKRARKRPRQAALRRTLKEELEEKVFAAEAKIL